MKQPENNDAAADALEATENLETGNAQDDSQDIDGQQHNDEENKPRLLSKPREDTVAIQHPEDGHVYHVPFDDLTHFQTPRLVPVNPSSATGSATSSARIRSAAFCSSSPPSRQSRWLTPRYRTGTTVYAIPISCCR
ncbi:hypothetical protein [Pseudoglutamicibacter albus]|uniref:hypothetical protein n=1 Tax=Pseudoglutamicibacter albus TaxID=98671 RepID=UPI003622D8D8